MNILFLSELFYPHGGGAELATYLYAKLLSKAKLNVAVVTNRFAGEPVVSKEENFAVYRLPLLKKTGSVKYSILQRFDVLFSSFMKRMMKWADIVYVPRFWFSAIPLAKVYGKPVVVHIHDYTPICPLACFYRSAKVRNCNHYSQLCCPKCIYFYERTKGRGLTETLASVMLNSTFGRYLNRFVELSDAIICVSRAQKDVITRQIPSLNGKIHVIYNPLPDLSSIDIEGDDFGYFGGPDPMKGFFVLCEAMKQVKNEKLIVQATKFPNSSIYLGQSTNKLKILLHVKLFDKAYERLYAQVRAAIVPSVWPEPAPYVVLEAILRGRLVVASRIGGIPELVEGCEGAFLFEAGNPSELAQKLEYTSSLSREVVADLGANGKETVLRRFSNERAVYDFANICCNLA